MIKLKYVGEKTSYDISFKTLSNSVVQITGNFPVKEKGFVLFREENEDDQWNYKEFTTVYREIDEGAQFSSDGSVYVAPVQPVPTVTFLAGSGGSLNGDVDQSVNDYSNLIIPMPVPDENYVFLGWMPEIPVAGAIEKDVRFQAVFSYVPTLEEVKAAKLQEVSAACEQTIYAGIDVAFPNGVEHFSLTEKDQINLFGKQAQLAAGLEQMEYHQDGHPCRYYTAEEMQMIITTAMFHVSYHTTYCNGLNMWIAGAESKDEVSAIYYGSNVPEEYQSEVLRDYLAKIAAQSQEV